MALFPRGGVQAYYHINCMGVSSTKAKALGVKRIVHRVSIPLTQLLGQKTEISWITDGNW